LSEIERVEVSTALWEFQRQDSHPDREPLLWASHVVPVLFQAQQKGSLAEVSLRSGECLELYPGSIMMTDCPLVIAAVEDEGVRAWMEPGYCTGYPFRLAHPIPTGNSSFPPAESRRETTGPSDRYFPGGTKDERAVLSTTARLSYACQDSRCACDQRPALCKGFLPLRTRGR
jgi:hypothetical protein